MNGAYDMMNVDNKINEVVYFISDGEYVKIGYSRDFKIRIKELQVGHPRLLRIAFVIGGGARLEGHIHKLCARHRTRGEWFRLSPVMRAFMRSLERLCAFMNLYSPIFPIKKRIIDKCYENAASPFTQVLSCAYYCTYCNFTDLSFISHNAELAECGDTTGYGCGTCKAESEWPIEYVVFRSEYALLKMRHLMGDEALA